MKKLLALLISACMIFTMSANVMAYSDVEEGAYASEAIAVLSNLGIVNGFEDGTVRPNQLITRAETATLIVNALNMKADAQTAVGTSQFVDVNTQAAWATGFVNVGVAQGFVSGYDVSTFGPLDNVTFAQMCKMLTCITGYGDYAAVNGGWPNGYITIAAQIGLTDKVVAAPTAELTRGQVFQMIYNALTTPMLGVYEYNLNGNTYTQLDGKHGRAFTTLLSEKFDGYVADVVITETPASNSSLDNDKVVVNVNKADYWPETEEPVNSNTVIPNTELYTIVDVNDYVLQTGKAVIVVNEDDELVMVYFAPNGKTTTKTLDAAAYVPQTELVESNQFETNGKIRFGSTYYKVDAEAVIYVNGAPTNIDVTNESLDALVGRAQGVVKLVKDNSSNSYSAIFVDYYQIAKVTSVDVDRDETVVSLVNTKELYSDDTEFDEIVITNDGIEEGNTIVKVIKNGSSVELGDLYKGDIIAYAVDFENETDLEDPKFINIIATDDVASGTVTKIDEDEYTIGGKVYELLDDVSLELKDTVDLVLDPFGRVYSTEVNATSDKYAIVLKVDDREDTITMLLPNGDVKTYANEAEVDIDNDTDLIDRVVKYTIKNSTKTITDVDVMDVEVDTLEYKARTGKLGINNITTSTNVIDATKVESAADARKASNYATFDVDDFVNGTTYDAIVIKTNTYVNFVIITSVGTVLGEDSRFAVALTEPSKYYTEDDDECYIADVLYNGKVEEFKFVEEDMVEIGDIFFFETDAYDMVDVVYPVDAIPDEVIDSDEWGFNIWNERKAIQVAAGVIVDVDDKSITFASIEQVATGTLDTNLDLDDTYEDGIITYGIADDMVSYVFDVNAHYVDFEDKVKVKAPKASTLDKYEIDNTGKYEGIDAEDVVEAIVMIVDGDVVAIFSTVR